MLKFAARGAREKGERKREKGLRKEEVSKYKEVSKYLLTY